MLDFLNHVLALIPSASAPVLVGVALVVEFVLRIVPSAKPLGLLHLVSDSLKGAAAIFAKVAALLDRILPQVIAAPKV